MKGSLIGIPLTYMQHLAYHAHTGHDYAMHASAVAVNFCLGHAIYDADRAAPSPPPLSTRLCAVACAAFYASDSWTLPLAPVALVLHARYAALKPRLAAWKPFVVAVCWTAATYAQPLLLEHDPRIASDCVTPAFIFLSILALSHAADIPDIDEDRAHGVWTPAVRMGRAESARYATACALGCWAVHRLAAGYAAGDFAYDAALGVAVTLVLLRNDDVEGATGSDWLLPCVFAIAAPLCLSPLAPPTVSFANELLRSTEYTHQWAIEAAIGAVDLCERIPYESVRRGLVDVILSCIAYGDRVGSLLLQSYADFVRHSLH